MRWLAISLFILFGAVGFVFGYPSKLNISVYLGLVSVLLVFNLATQAFYSGKPKTVRPVIIGFQLAFDLLILTAALNITGGVENPFINLFLLNAALGALLIPGYLSLPFIVLTHGLLATLQIEYISSIPGAPNQVKVYMASIILHVLVFGFWLVMRSLGDYFETQGERQTQDRLVLEKQDRLRAIGALTAGFSHEFASPLNTAKVRIERLVRKNSGEDATEAHSAILACEQIIRNMNTSQIDARAFVLQTISIEPFIRTVVETWKSDRAGISVRLELENLGLVSLPPINFTQVLLNLLDNAYDAQPTGSITLRLLQKNSRLHLTVEDQGGGFSTHILENMGEPFITTKAEGTGLGLYVSQLFAQSLGGELKIENVNQGARVTIEWPYAEVNHE